MRTGAMLTAGIDAFFGIRRPFPLIISATPAFDRGASRVFEIGPSDLYIRNKAEASEKLRNLGGKYEWKKTGPGMPQFTAYRHHVFLFHIFPSRLRTFSEAPALFTMYKSEGPISKTREPPRSNAGVAEMMRGERPSNAEEGIYPPSMAAGARRLLPLTRVCSPPDRRLPSSSAGDRSFSTRSFSSRPTATTTVRSTSTTRR